jgi:hypothetical protein
MAIDKISKAGWVSRKIKINEIIDKTNPLLNIRVNKSSGITNPSVSYSQNSVVITIRDYEPELRSLRARVFALENP